VDKRPQWPKYVAPFGFITLGGVIGFKCAGGPTQGFGPAQGFGSAQEFRVGVALGVLFGSAFGAILWAVVMNASRRNRD